MLGAYSSQGDGVRAAEDEALVRRYQQGDTEAFKALFDQYYKYVYRVLVAKGVPAVEAEDLTQDLFVRLTASLKAFAGASTFKTYLDRSITHKLVDFYRKRGTARLVLEAELGDALAAAILDHAAAAARAPTPASILEAAEFREAISRCLGEVAHPTCRAVLALWLDGVRLSQVAHALSVPPGTAASHLARGRELLKRCLKARYAPPAGRAT